MVCSRNKNILFCKMSPNISLLRAIYDRKSFNFSKLGPYGPVDSAVALPHLHALLLTLVQRPHLLCINASKAATMHSSSGEFRCVNGEIADSFESVQMASHALAQILVQVQHFQQP